MLSIIIIVLLISAFLSGTRRGLLLQVIYTIGYFITFILAKVNYQSLGAKLELLVPYPQPGQDSQLVYYDAAQALHLDKAFYSAVGFILIMAAGWVIVRIIGSICSQVALIPIIKQVNILAGGFLQLLVVYVGIFLLLYTLTFIPVPIIQQQFENSRVAQFMVEKTPILSKSVYNWWVTQSL